MAELIYLDFNATTPLDPRTLDQMMPWFGERFWNAASAHAGGRLAADAVAAARSQVAGMVGARPSEIVWTSGATEANNLALKGAVALAAPERRRIVTFATEHKAVLDTVGWLAVQGNPVTVLPVEADGSLSLDILASALESDDVAVVSVMAANNETGVLANLPVVAELTHAAGALLHSDATQVVGRIPFDVVHQSVDMASFSAHKLYGPKGVGALFVSRSVDVGPLIHGGGHERGRRSGTLNVPGIVGFGVAAEMASSALAAEPTRLAALIDQFLATLRSEIPAVESITRSPNCLPNTVNIRIVGADADAVMANAPNVAISSGSACTALVPAPSHVLLAMGLSHEAAMECLRISVGRTTTEQDVEVGAQSIARAASRVRQLVA